MTLNLTLRRVLTPGALRQGMRLPWLLLLAYLAGLLVAPGLRADSSKQGLTLAERVECLRAIEGVYWRHRIWPAQNLQPKPDLAQVVTEEELARRAEDSLRMTTALRSRYHREITAADLQAEMNRMAGASRNPAVLAEIFDALQNDPYRIAECLAWPALAERRLRTAFSFDAQVHSARAGAARAEYRAARAMNDLRNLTGETQDSILRKGTTAGETLPTTDSIRDLDPQEWQLELDRLASDLGASLCAACFSQ